MARRLVDTYCSTSADADEELCSGLAFCQYLRDSRLDVADELPCALWTPGDEAEAMAFLDGVTALVRSFQS